MKELELMKELKKKTLEKIIEKHGTHLGKHLNCAKLSIWDVRCIMYQEALRIAERELKENLKEELEDWQETRR